MSLLMCRVLVCFVSSSSLTLLSSLNSRGNWLFLYLLQWSSLNHTLGRCWVNSNIIQYNQHVCSLHSLLFAATTQDSTITSSHFPYWVGLGLTFFLITVLQGAAISAMLGMRMKLLCSLALEFSPRALPWIIITHLGPC